MKNLKFLNTVSGWAILFSFCFTGCISLSTHQTGRTNGEGITTVHGSYNLGLIQEEQIIGVNTQNESVHLVGLGLVQGMTERFDAGFNLNSAGNVQFLGKYQLAGNQTSKLASSVGADVGFSSMALLFGIVNYNASFISFNSFHPDHNVAITFSPRYSYLSAADGWRDAELVNDYNHLFGYSAGVMVGDRHRFSFEISQFTGDGRLMGQRPLFSIAYIMRIQE